MRKKTGFLRLFIFVFITGTAHLAAMEQEEEPNNVAKTYKFDSSPIEMIKILRKVHPSLVTGQESTAIFIKLILNPPAETNDARNKKTLIGKLGTELSNQIFPYELVAIIFMYNNIIEKNDTIRKEKELKKEALRRCLLYHNSCPGFMKYSL